MASDSSNAQYDSWLTAYLSRNGGVSGTVHAVSGEALVLMAAVNIPPKVMPAIERIPKGKGMAGLAWSRAEPVKTCNLQEDTSGDIRPGAKAVEVTAALAFPVFDAAKQVRATVGIGYTAPREFSDAELAKLLTDAASLP
ncbi:MAG: hypothetical protein U0172_03100 [Nitrospiraceae bacterium]